MRERLAEGRAPTITIVAAAVKAGASIEDMTGERGMRARLRAADAIRERRPELAAAILAAPDWRGGAPWPWLVVRGVPVRPMYAWDPPDLAKRIEAAMDADEDGEAAAKADGEAVARIDGRVRR